MASFICRRCASKRAVQDISSPLTGTLAKPSPSLVARQFSSTRENAYPREAHKGKSFPGRDANKMRGVSAIRATGLRKRQSLSVKISELTSPVQDFERTPIASEYNEEYNNHGLWGFFAEDKKPFSTPEDLSKHGRPWTRIELARKNWEELHTLWWTCVRERNRLWTDSLERERVKAGYGDSECEARDQAVKTTMTNIKRVLTERYYAYEDAREMAKDDPEVEIQTEGRETTFTFNPNTEYSAYTEADVLEQDDTPARSIPSKAQTSAT